MIANFARNRKVYLPLYTFIINKKNKIITAKTGRDGCNFVNSSKGDIGKKKSILEAYNITSIVTHLNFNPFSIFYIAPKPFSAFDSLINDPQNASSFRQIGG